MPWQAEDPLLSYFNEQIKYIQKNIKTVFYINNIKKNNQLSVEVTYDGGSQGQIKWVKITEQ